MKTERVISGWHQLYLEVQHYFEHEEGVSALNWDPKGSTGDPTPPRFAPGADYWTMMTVIERLREADTIMTFRPAKYALTDPELGKPGAAPVQTCVRLERPSCSMVLRSEHGNNKMAMRKRVASYEPTLYDEARKAYVAASKRVPPRRPKGRARSNILARFNRIFKLDDE